MFFVILDIVLIIFAIIFIVINALENRIFLMMIWIATLVFAIYSLSLELTT